MNSMPNINNKADGFSQELMMKFLEKNCPIKRTRREKSKKWTRSLIIPGGITGKASMVYPIGKTPLDVQLAEIITVLRLVFAFADYEIIPLASQYLKIDE